MSPTPGEMSAFTEFRGNSMEAGRPVAKEVGRSRQRLECVRFHRRFGPRPDLRSSAVPDVQKAVLQARALQTLARLLVGRSEATAFSFPGIL